MLGVAGLGGLATGAAFAAIAKQRYDTSLGHCDPPPNQNTCSHHSVLERDAARSAGDVSTVAFIAGGALAAGGLGLLISSFTGGRAPAGGVSVTVAVDPGRAAAFGLKGSF